MVEPEPPPPVALLYHSDQHALDENHDESSIQSARADLELLQAAYPDEIAMDDATGTSSFTNAACFPLMARLHFSKTASCQLQWRHGYPTSSNVEIIAWRAKDSSEQQRLEQALQAWRHMALEWEGHEGVGLVCCAAAMEAWNDPSTSEAKAAAAVVEDALEEEMAACNCAADEDHTNDNCTPAATSSSSQPSSSYNWTSGEPLVDRKSIFQAHLCRLQKEADVAEALHQLLTSSSKMQRATHHMYAYRIAEQHHPFSTGKKDRSDNHNVDAPSAITTTILKHDNSDDGEDGAGSRLAHLLQMRQDQDVLVVVSRWYGGTPLGPKRFAHISNAARSLLVQQQQDGNCSISSSRVNSKGHGRK